MAENQSKHLKRSKNKDSRDRFNNKSYNKNKGKQSFHRSLKSRPKKKKFTSKIVKSNHV